MTPQHPVHSASWARPAALRGTAWLLVLLALLLSALPARAEIRLDLRDVELRSFVEIVAEQTQRNFIVDPGVSGTVSVVAPAPVSADAILEIFDNVLESNGLTIVPGDDVDRIVPMRDARSLRASGPGGRSTFETRVLPVESENLDELLDVVLPLLPDDAVLTPVYSSGLLVLSDRRENIDRIANVIRQLDTPRTREIETIRLDHADAEDTVTVIETLAIVPSGASLSADRRANAIIMSGPNDFRQRVRDLLRQIDTPQRRRVSRVVHLDYAEAEPLSEVLRQSLPQLGENDDRSNAASITAEPQTNALLISAPSDEIEDIVNAVRALDREPAQVLIEAVIFELSAGSFSDISVQFGGILNDAIGGGTSFSLDGRSSLLGLLSAAASGNTPNFGSGGAVGVRGTDFAGLLGALASERSTRLLSTPAVTTLNNQEAEIVVAQNVPFVTGSFATVGDSATPERPFQTIERRDVGLSLKVRPQITSDNQVRMAIAQEASNLTGASAAAGGEITARRNLATNVLVGDGRVIVLGGLMEDSSRTSDQRVPGLGNLPLIGNLFRSSNVDEEQRVLLVMLRPRVIRSGQDAESVTRDIARRSESVTRQINQRDPQRRPSPQRSGFPFDGVDLNQPFDSLFVDKVVRERLYPALPPRLQTNVGQ